jgi:hypothetical protein
MDFCDIIHHIERLATITRVVYSATPFRNFSPTPPPAPIIEPCQPEIDLEAFYNSLPPRALDLLLALLRIAQGYYQPKQLPQAIDQVYGRSHNRESAVHELIYDSFITAQRIDWAFHRVCRHARNRALMAGTWPDTRKPLPISTPSKSA